MTVIASSKKYRLWYRLVGKVRLSMAI